MHLFKCSVYILLYNFKYAFLNMQILFQNIHVYKGAIYRFALQSTEIKVHVTNNSWKLGCGFCDSY